MNDYFIEPEWLAAVRGTLFYYPAAMHDCLEPITVFQEQIDTFWFCDKNYAAGLSLPPALPSESGFHLIKSKKEGAVHARLERRLDSSGRTYAFLEPSRLKEIYERQDGRQLLIVRRRGFGQIAITREFGEKSLGVFMHRRDSMGEAGSGVFFLANSNARYEPCGRLFEKLSKILSEKSLVISDGSNSRIPWVSKFHNSDKSGDDAYLHHRGRQYRYCGFQWVCVGWLSNKYGPTLVWGLTRN